MWLFAKGQGRLSTHTWFPNVCSRGRLPHGRRAAVFRAWAKHDYLQGGQLLPVFNPATLEPTITTSAFSIVFSSTQGFIIHDELYSWRPTQEN